MPIHPDMDTEPDIVIGSFPDCRSGIDLGGVCPL